MLKVAGGKAVEDEVDGRSLLDEIAREGGQRWPTSRSSLVFRGSRYPQPRRWPWPRHPSWWRRPWW